MELFVWILVLVGIAFVSYNLIIMRHNVQVYGARKKIIDDMRNYGETYGHFTPEFFNMLVAYETSKLTYRTMLYCLRIPVHELANALREEIGLF